MSPSTTGRMPPPRCRSGAPRRTRGRGDLAHDGDGLGAQGRVLTPHETSSHLTAMKEPMRVAPTQNIWIHESLEGEARRLWERTRD